MDTSEAGICGGFIGRKWLKILVNVLLAFFAALGHPRLASTDLAYGVIATNCVWGKFCLLIKIDQLSNDEYTKNFV